MTLPAAVIGCGRIGSRYDEGRSAADPRSHAGAYVAASSGVELVAGVDPSADRRAAFERRWGVPAYPRVRDMLARVRPALWSVCTPAGVRHRVIEAALAGGARAIWAEKPLASDARTAAQVVQLARAARVSIAVNYTRRWDRGHIAVAEAIRRGDVGQLQHVVVHYTRGLLNYGSHAIDLLRWFVGEPRWAWARHAHDRAAADPSPVVVLGFARGVVATLMPIQKRAHDTFEVDVVGADARFRLRDRGSAISVERVAADTEFDEPRVLRPATGRLPFGTGGMMLAVVDDLKAAVLHGRAPRCRGDDGVAALEIVDAALESLRTGRVAVLGRRR